MGAANLRGRVRILYHHRTSALDGSAVHIEGLISGLKRLGAEVEVVAPSIAAPEAGAPAEGRWLRAARRRLPRLVHELAECVYNVFEVVRLSRAVVSFRPDVIYQRSNLYLLSGAWVARRHGIPLIEEVNAPYFLERSRHGGIALGSVAAWSERKAWRSADAIVTISHVLADIVSRTGVPANRIHVMPNGVDESISSARAIDPATKRRLGLDEYIVLGFTGFVRDWNGLDVVLELLAEPQGQRWFLLIVGDGPARSSLECRARQLGVESRVRFTGVVRHADVASMVSAFDIALQPAANPYASPLKLFEYMALKRAIVAPDQPNIREVLTDQKDALLFDPSDPSAFSAAIGRLAEDSELRARLATAGAATLRERDLSWRQNASRVLALAEELVEGFVGVSDGAGARVGNVAASDAIGKR